MATIPVRGAVLRGIDEGPRDAPAIIFSNSLGCSLEMWDAQAQALLGTFRIIRYDNRGHGQSSIADRPTSIAEFADDALAVLDHFGVERAHWCGLSLGGMIGQVLAARKPQRLDKVVLANTTSYYSDPSFWRQRIAAVRSKGLLSIADAVLAGWLTEGFRSGYPAVAEQMRAMFLATPQQGYIAACDAIAQLDNRDLLPLIRRPTRVIAGRSDRSTPLSAAEAIVNHVPDAELSVLDAAHISNVEQSGAFTRVLEEFFA
jgi:3-oxoadipate enol-lactonase